MIFTVFSWERDREKERERGRKKEGRKRERTGRVAQYHTDKKWEN